MTSPEALLLLGCALAAQIIGTMAGFGAATILTPVAVLFMDVKTAIAFVAAFHLLSNAFRLVYFGRAIEWTTWLQFGVMGVVCSLVGATLTTRLSSAVLQAALGVFLLVYAAVSSLLSTTVTLPKRPSTLVGGGIASGLIAGLIGTGGAIRSACLLAFGLPREAYLGTSAAIAFAVDLTRLPVYMLHGFIPSTRIALMVSVVAVAFVGAWLGQRLIRRVSSTAFRWFVLSVLALMGVKLLLDGWYGLA